MTPVLTAKTAQSASPNQGRTVLPEIARFGDLVILIAMFAAAAAALDIGSTRGQFSLAPGASVLLLVAGCVSYSVAFGRMQALGLTSDSTPQADFLTMLMHPVYVIVQSGMELFLAVRSRQSAIESPQLAAIVRSVDLSGLMMTLRTQQTAASVEESATAAESLPSRQLT